ncbi:MAG: response regulator [Chloroflexi bacterium]|nr:response regulator [Chloroflexota bacterium]
MKIILIVDDEPDVLEFLAGDLELASYKTDKASDGVEAVLKVLNGGYDAVLMDIRMPKLDGIGALRIIRRINAKLPVIMFTGQAGEGDMAETSRLGAFTCLLKPVSVAKLLETLTQVFTYTYA